MAEIFDSTLEPGTKSLLTEKLMSATAGKGSKRSPNMGKDFLGAVLAFLDIKQVD